MAADPPRPSLTGYVSELLEAEGIRAEVQVLRVDAMVFILITLALPHPHPTLFQGEDSFAASLKRKILPRLDPSVSLQGIFWSTREEPVKTAVPEVISAKKFELTRKLQELRLRRTDVGLRD